LAVLWHSAIDKQLKTKKLLMSYRLSTTITNIGTLMDAIAAQMDSMVAKNPKQKGGAGTEGHVTARAADDHEASANLPIMDRIKALAVFLPFGKGDSGQNFEWHSESIWNKGRTVTTTSKYLNVKGEEIAKGKGSTWYNSYQLSINNCMRCRKLSQLF